MVNGMGNWGEGGHGIGMSDGEGQLRSKFPRYSEEAKTLVESLEVVILMHPLVADLVQRRRSGRP